MGSLTQSLLQSSAEKTSEAADYSNKLGQAAPQAAQSSTASKPTAAQKAIHGGEKKATDSIKGAVEGGAKKILGAFKDGGTIPKTGPYIMHEGEEVIPAKRASEYRKVFVGRKSKTQ